MTPVNDNASLDNALGIEQGKMKQDIKTSNAEYEEEDIEQEEEEK